MLNMSSKDHDLKAIIDSLYNEYSQVQLIWQEFKELYARDSKRIDLMNNVAPGFFSMVQNLMIEALVIRLSRVTDAVGSGNRENLTLRRIPDALPEDKREFAEELESLIDSAKTQVDQVRVWRDKRIAHLDLRHFVSEDRVEFKIGYTQIRECLEAIHSVLNRTSMIMWDNELSSRVLLSGGRAASLIAALKRV